jgi:hypothetical protein
MDPESWLLGESNTGGHPVGQGIAQPKRPFPTLPRDRNSSGFVAAEESRKSLIG